MQGKYSLDYHTRCAGRLLLTSAFLLVSQLQILVVGLQAFDVYRPSNNFSHKSPGSPAAVVCMGGSELPSITEIKGLEAAAGGAALLFARVVGGSVTFFEL